MLCVCLCRWKRRKKDLNQLTNLPFFFSFFISKSSQVKSVVRLLRSQSVKWRGKRRKRENVPNDFATQVTGYFFLSFFLTLSWWNSKKNPLNCRWQASKSVLSTIDWQKWKFLLHLTCNSCTSWYPLLVSKSLVNCISQLTVNPLPFGSFRWVSCSPYSQVSRQYGCCVCIHFVTCVWWRRKGQRHSLDYLIDWEDELHLHQWLVRLVSSN